jgi:lysyl-tRNA synthetase class 2
MLEWYRLGFDHFQLMEEVAVLLKITLKCQQPTQITYQDLFKRSVALDPLTASTEEVLNVIKQHNKISDWLLKENDIDILLQFVFSEIIEPTIGLTEPCFVYNFPRSQASLAKISACDHRVAERFECYFQGIELVNGFHELTDAQQQLERFQEDNFKRLQMGLPKRLIDKNFIQALQQGLPACSGVALGIDRLVMLALKITHIEQVQTFPIECA